MEAIPKSTPEMANSIQLFMPIWYSALITSGWNNPIIRNMLWGVRPLLIDKKDSADELFKEAVRKSQEAGYVKKGDIVVLTAGVPLAVSGTTNMIHVVEV